jgi:MFS transporter, YNFM family, putative membrane transport protein
MSVDPRRVAVGFCAACAFLNLYAPQSILPSIAQDLGVSAVQASAILTAGTFAVALTAPFTGAISDLLGRKRLIVGAMAILLVPTVMLALAQDLSQLAFWRFMQGLLLPPIFTVTVAYVGNEWPPREAATVIGIYTASSAAGGFVGRFIPGALESTFTWRGGFVAIALINLFFLTMVVWLLPREKNFVRAASLMASLRQMVSHLRNPKLVATYAIGFGAMFNFMATFTYISFHLAAPPYNRSAFFLGSIFVVYLVGSALAPWSGRFIYWLGRRTFVLWALGIWMGGLLLTLAPAIAAIVLGLLIFSTCGILTQASSTGYVAVTAPAGTSAAVGLYVSSFYLGGTVGGWLPGFAYETGGWPASLTFVAAMLALMALIVAIFWKEPVASETPQISG